MNITDTANHAKAIVDEVERVIIGKSDTVQQAVATMLCEGHMLIEDIPGVGKTTLAKALARSIGGEFRRIQFTPDLLPSDVTGSSIFNQKTGEFEFRPGPVFGNVVLVDEINRATPKTQASLLEAMEERQVTTDGETRRLPRPFFVLATQNSIEMTGTYPLPEAQLDRFFSRLTIGYPQEQDEVSILGQQQISHPLELVQEVVTMANLLEMQVAVRDVFVSERIREYIVKIVRGTRESTHFSMGSSPRGSLHLMRAAQARAAMSGSDIVRPDDVKAMASIVLSHRVMPRAEAKGHTAEVIQSILANQTAPVPVA